ncbi:MAG: DUF438 domain-containing protein [Acidobacteriota bacterium]
MSEIIDNRAHRIRTLKEVIRHLHEGRAPAEVKSRLAALVRQCDASEIAAMEQELMADGVPVRAIMGMCDLHAEVVRDILVERASAPVPPGHPADTFHRENEALGEQARAMRAALAALAPEGMAADARVDPARLFECRRVFAGLMDVEKHYLRKEHLLFSMLERHGITGPSKVMWGKDDEARGLLQALGTALAADGGTAAEWRTVAQAVAEPALRAVEEMIVKEERILLPMSLQNLTETEWGEIFQQSPQFGYCLVDPRDGYRPPAIEAGVPEAAAAEAARSGVAFTPFTAGKGARLLPMAEAAPVARQPSAPEAVGQGLVVLPTGALSLDQLKAIFVTLPVDLTFVDADDRVRFFSEGPNRVFARPKAILGRLVQHCHPPASVGVVERILSDFRSGRQNVAEFWINFRGRFAHIRYFALRDEAGTYLGTLEVTQDLTHERALEGERRLLQYGS